MEEITGFLLNSHAYCSKTYANVYVETSVSAGLKFQDDVIKVHLKWHWFFASLYIEVHRIAYDHSVNMHFELGYIFCAFVMCILQTVVDICMKLDEGKYLLVKDPNKPLVRYFFICLACPLWGVFSVHTWLKSVMLFAISLIICDICFLKIVLCSCGCFWEWLRGRTTTWGKTQS